MKKLLITRVLPDANLAAARARYDVTVRDTAEGLTVSGAANALQEYDAILPTLGDQFTSEAFAGDIRCGVLAYFGVGYNHIDAAAAAKTTFVGDGQAAEPQAERALLEIDVEPAAGREGLDRGEIAEHTTGEGTLGLTRAAGLDFLHAHGRSSRAGQADPRAHARGPTID